MVADAKQKGAPAYEAGEETERAATLEFLNDVRLRITVEFGRSTMTIRDILALSRGSVVELNKISGEPLDIRLNGKLVARGEAVIVNDRFGIRVTEIVSPEDFEQTMLEKEE